MAYFLNNINIENQFIKTTKEKYFVDKSNFVNKINTLIGTASQFIYIIKPRRSVSLYSLYTIFNHCLYNHNVCTSYFVVNKKYIYNKDLNTTFYI